MKTLVALPKRIGVAVWKVIKAIAIGIYVVLEYIVKPITWLWRLFD